MVGLSVGQRWLFLQVFAVRALISVPKVLRDGTSWYTTIRY